MDASQRKDNAWAPALSLRGRRALQPALSYWEMAVEALKNEATDDNLDGYVVVAIAENRILNGPKVGLRC
jgi:hypothetical protein